MSHAVIFVGEHSARNHALSYAKSLNCENGNNCGECVSCRVFESGNHPDTFFIKATKQKGIGVEEVREQIVMPMATKPFKYKHKVFVIEDQITPQAQNALLKTIEEPAPYGVFLFLAQNTFGFLPTILSRCVVKNIRGEFSGDADFQPLAEEIIRALQAADIPQAFALYKKLEPLEKNELQIFLDTLYVTYGKKINAESFHFLDAPKIISDTKRILSQNANTQLALELMLFKLRRTP
jgi:DNA polymerase III delta prime subunit